MTVSRREFLQRSGAGLAAAGMVGLAPPQTAKAQNGLIVGVDQSIGLYPVWLPESFLITTSSCSNGIDILHGEAAFEFETEEIHKSFEAAITKNWDSHHKTAPLVLVRFGVDVYDLARHIYVVRTPVDRHATIIRFGRKDKPCLISPVYRFKNDHSA